MGRSKQLWTYFVPRVVPFLISLFSMTSWIFIFTLANLCLMVTPLGPPILLLMVFLASIYAHAPLWPFQPMCKRPPRPRWKRERKFRRRRLHYSLVQRCRRRTQQHPSRMDVTCFPSPFCSKHRRWRRRRRKSKTRQWKQRVVEHRAFLSGHPPLFKLEELPPWLIEDFCHKSGQDFLKLPRLLAEFEGDYLQSFVEQQDHQSNVRTLLQRAVSHSAVVRGQDLDESTVEAHRLLPNGPTYADTNLIWDTGASFGLTPFRCDFIDYVECNIEVKDVTKINNVVGIGTTLHKFKDINGVDVFLPCVSYHLQTTDIHLFSPQTYHQLHGGMSEVHGDRVDM